MYSCRLNFVSAFFVVILLSGISAASASAEIFYEIGIKGIYEDNVAGLLSDQSSGTATSGTGPGPGGMMAGAMGSGPGPGGGYQTSYTGTGSGKSSDTSLDISAEFGGSANWGENMTLFLSGGVERTSYSQFTEFDMTAGSVSAGIARQLGNRIAARIAAAGLVKRFEDPARDSTAFRGSVLFKEQISSRLWLKEGYAYEQNNADSAFFTYTGNSLVLLAGYSLAARTTLLTGYNYLVRDYDEPTGFQETANTFSLGLEWELVRHWFLDLQYDRRSIESTLAETDTTGNIFSFGARYSY